MPLVNTDPITIKVKNKKRFFSVIFLVLWLVAVITFHKDLLNANANWTFNNLAFAVISFLVTVVLIRMLFGWVAFTISYGELIITKFGLFYKKVYNIEQITYPSISTGINDNTYWDIVGFHIYDKTSALSFIYNNRPVIIKADFKSEDGETLIQLLQNKKARR